MLRSVWVVSAVVLIAVAAFVVLVMAPGAWAAAIPKVPDGCLGDLEAAGAAIVLDSTTDEPLNPDGHATGFNIARVLGKQIPGYLWIGLDVATVPHDGDGDGSDVTSRWDFLPPRPCGQVNAPCGYGWEEQYQAIAVWDSGAVCVLTWREEFLGGLVLSASGSANKVHVTPKAWAAPAPWMEGSGCDDVEMMVQTDAFGAAAQGPCTVYAWSRYGTRLWSYYTHGQAMVSLRIPGA